MSSRLSSAQLLNKDSYESDEIRALYKDDHNSKHERSSHVDQLETQTQKKFNDETLLLGSFTQSQSFHGVGSYNSVRYGILNEAIQREHRNEQTRVKYQKKSNQLRLIASKENLSHSSNQLSKRPFSSSSSQITSGNPLSDRKDKNNQDITNQDQVEVHTDGNVFVDIAIAYESRLVYLVSFSLFCDFFLLTAVIPILSSILSGSTSSTMLGILFASKPMMQVVCNPFMVSNGS
jgi:FKBP-type peptidyl-prolyl cis-trans isomerase